MKKKVMKIGKKVVLIGSALVFMGSQQALAQEERMKELEEKIEILLEEVETLKEKEPGRSEEKIHFHGYGELHYNNTNKEGKNDKMDFHRMVIGWKYRFNPWIILDAEVDFEHAATEMELEYAHISFLLSEAFNVRMGSMLMPVGYLNEFHEPSLFYSVERPYVEKYVIPTTWQEGGVGILGAPRPDLKYRLYLVGGLDASKFTADSGIRKGRGRVASAKADDLAVVARIEHTGIPGLNLGLSGYLGDAAQGNSALGEARVSIIEGDIRYRRKNCELAGLIASVNIDDTDKIKAATGKVIGEEVLGWYVEVAHHSGRLFLPEGQDLVLFVRQEEFNTQKKVAASLTADPANDRQVTTFGLAYYPASQVTLKADLEAWKNGAGDDWRQFNMGIAYMF